MAGVKVGQARRAGPERAAEAGRRSRPKDGGAGSEPDQKDRSRASAERPGQRPKEAIQPAPKKSDPRSVARQAGVKINV